MFRGGSKPNSSMASKVKVRSFHGNGFFFHSQHITRSRLTNARSAAPETFGVGLSPEAGPNSSAGQAGNPLPRSPTAAPQTEQRPRISSVPHRGLSIRRAQRSCGARRAPHAGIESRSAAGRPSPSPRWPSWSVAHGTGRPRALSLRERTPSFLPGLRATAWRPIQSRRGRGHRRSGNRSRSLPH